MSMPLLTAIPNSKAEIRERVKTGQVTWTWPLVMLVSRITLFALGQALIAVVFALQRNHTPWEASAAW